MKQPTAPIDPELPSEDTQNYRLQKISEIEKQFIRDRDVTKAEQVSSHVDDFNTRNKVLTAKLLRQGYRYHKLRKAFSKFYRRHFDIVSKYNVGLKTLLLQGLSEPEFYGDLVYKFRKIIGKNDFPYHFKKIIVRYKKIGYNINVMQQTACLVVNPIKVNSFAYLFNCTTVGRTSD